MKLRFKHQKFQEDAVNATCDIFTGQRYSTQTFLVDQGNDDSLLSQLDVTGFGNADFTIDESQMLHNLHEVQKRQGIPINKKIERLNNRPIFTIEMETGTGKTYTYIRTIFELNKRYGWSKFIVVVPSVAIREGVYKSFQTTADHFAEDYGKRIRFFIYNSSKLNELDQFADNNNINVMIINTQAFNSRGADSRRIRIPLDSFRSRRPIDVIAATKPIIIVDEPQSVLGTEKSANTTRSAIAEFRPLFYLTYSATHREKFNQVYKLDAVDAYQMQLVKKITVKGITVRGSTASNGYLYLQKINTYPNRKPTATVVFEFDSEGKTGLHRKTKTLERGDDIYEHSGELEAYRNGYTITEINARDDGGFVEFSSGHKIHEGEVVGDVNEKDVRRLQIRETIMTHLETEHKLYKKGIKVLSLFFIDEVAKYKNYIDGVENKGVYAKIFEEEFQKAIDIYLEQQLPFGEDAEFREYLKQFTPSEIHAGYFSIDKKGHAINSEIKRGESSSNDSSAYDLIMKDKERLLSFEEPVRFIFSHSALREGWDNPNVFQICTLRESDAEIKKRQEIGRGLRLSVDKNGNRMDAEVLGNSHVHDTNILTVIASESYETFAASLQSEFDEITAARPKEVSATLFLGRNVIDDSGEKTLEINDGIASDIYLVLKENGIVDDNRHISPDYREMNDEQKIETLRNVVEGLYDKERNSLSIYAESLQKILAQVYDPKQGSIITDARKRKTLVIDREKYASKAFQNLWNKINEKTYYTVNFDEEELIKRCVEALDRELQVTKTEAVITTGHLENKDKDSLEMKRDRVASPVNLSEIASRSVKYDLIGEFSKDQNDGGTSLTRKTIAKILTQIQPETFDKFKQNPEEFIHNAKSIINGQKARTVIEHIEYDTLNEKWNSAKIFLDEDITGVLGQNLIETPRHNLYDSLRYDSEVEKNFAEELEKQDAIEVYVKLPKSFYIETPMGHYNPDWAIAFKDNAGVKHIYFVAETKGTSAINAEINLKGIEKAKIDCAKKHFNTICHGEYIYDVCNSYEDLLKLVNSH